MPSYTEFHEPSVHEEWEAWKDVCSLLKDAGAVTEQDLASGVSLRGTPGLEILAAIRKWGALYLTLEQRIVCRNKINS